MKAKKFLAIALTLMLVVACLAVSALAEEPTLAEQIAAAEENSTVVIPAGTYELPNTVVIPKGVTLKGAGKDQTTLTITTTDGSGITINNSGVKIQDVTIDGNNITSNGYKC